MRDGIAPRASLFRACVQEFTLEPKRTTEHMTIRFDYNSALSDVIGPRHGLSVKAIESLRPRAKKIHADLVEKRKSATLGFFDLPYDDGLVRDIKSLVRKLGNIENFVVLGIGGSSLGAICLHNALMHNYRNMLPDKVRKGPRLFVLDNSDPEILARLLEWIDVKKTVFNVISKSGGTPETMAQFMVIVEMLKKKVGAKALAKHLVATTDRAKGLLRPFADANGLDSFLVPDNVGGRFSVLSSVGLVPAAVVGIPIERLLAGAREMDKRTSKNDLMQNPAYLNAAIHYLLDTKKSKTISVMMPYSNALREVSDWYCQLWAESLGKAKNIKGETVNIGQTPTKALGATDQHSQVQLYTEGPNDKVFTLIGVEQFRVKCPIPRSFRDIPALDYLRGYDMAGLLNAELDATEFALAKSQRPSVRITIDAITPENLGGLLYLLEVQTAFAGGLYEIDAFNQPGVEEGKKATAALMGRTTEQDIVKASEIAAFLKKKRRKAI
jgi:glucose-6-phosphate isomerase